MNEYDFDGPNAWSSQQRMMDANAHAGSEQLENGCIRLIHNFATKHRISDDEARVLLLDTGTSI
jgi:hypothetical protein